MSIRFFLIIALLSLSGCGDWTTIAISLSNESGRPVSEVSANFAGQLRKVKNLLPGQFSSLVAYGGEGEICLTYRQNGGTLRYSIDYMTQNMPAHYRAVIRDHGILAVSHTHAGFPTREPIIYRPLPPGRGCVA